MKELSPKRLKTKPLPDRIKKLRESYYRRMKHAPVAMARFDLNMNYIFATDRWKSDQQLKIGSLKGKNHYEIFPEIPARWKAMHRQVMAGKTLTGTENRFKRIDGTTEYVNWIATPWLNLSNKIEGMDIVSEIVTRRKNAEREVQDLRSELKKLISQKKLRFENLIEDERNLKRQTGNQISIASHQLKTPLSTVLTSCDLIALYIKSGEIHRLQEVNEAILKSTRRMIDTVNHFLGTIQSEAGVIRPYFQDTDLSFFLKEIAEELRYELKERQQIIIHPEKKLIVSIDHLLLREVLQNLISNAIKFSDEGKKIEIRFRKTKNHFYITVKDYGQGIKQGDQKNIFKKFFRSKKADGIPGTGLGLHIACQYARLMGGTISYKSKKSIGSTFIIKIKTNCNEKNSDH